MAFCAVGLLGLQVIRVWGQLVGIFIRSGRACEDYPRYLWQDTKDFREKSQIKTREMFKGVILKGKQEMRKHARCNTVKLPDWPTAICQKLN